MPQRKRARAAAAGGAVLALAAGAVVIALWDRPDNPPVHRMSAAPGESPPPAESVSPFDPEPRTTVFVQMPETHLMEVTDVGVQPVSSGSETGPRNPAAVGDGKDTGPFIDPDDEAGDYTYAPVSDVGDFIDPDAR